MDNFKIFKNNEFGSIRTIETNGETYFVGKDIAEALGYQNTRDALSKHIASDDKADVAIHDGSQNRNMTMQLKLVYELIWVLLCTTGKAIGDHVDEEDKGGNKT